MIPSQPKMLSELMIDRREFNNLVNVYESNSSVLKYEISKYEYPPGSNQFVCYKEYNVPKRLSEVEDFIKEIIRELYITNQAKHPCTVELLYFDLSDGNNSPIIIKRFYEHESLLNCFEDSDKKYSKWGKKYGPPNFEGTIYTLLMYRIARGLRYLHHLKILHRDLNLSKILIDENFSPHISGFGHSKIFDDNQQHSQIYGSLIFMAPEVRQSDRKRQFSFPADVFALALIFYCICEGKNYKPDLELQKMSIIKDDEKRWQEARKVLNARCKNKKMPGFEKTPEKLQELIMKMWEYKASDRPTMDQVCATLENEEYWFDRTDRDTFIACKNEIDEYEKIQIPLVTKCPPSFVEEAEEGLKRALNVQDDKKPEVNILTNYSYSQLQSVLELCKRWNKDAEFALGMVYYTGFKGIPRDYVTAAKLFLRAKEHGSPEADEMLLSIMQQAKLLEETGNEARAKLLQAMMSEASGRREEAFLLYAESAKRGSLAARGRLGSLLLKSGNMVQEAEELLRQAAGWKLEDEGGETDINERKIALFNLGSLNLYVKKEFNESIEIFEELLKMEFPDAAACLAVAYRKLGNNEKENEFLKIAAEQFSNNYAKLY